MELNYASNSYVVAITLCTNKNGTSNPGGIVDMIARALGQKLSTALGQPFVIDNRAGGSGQIGMPAVARAPADGYTLTISPASFLTTNKSVFKTLPYGMPSLSKQPV
jgi:tripartite-type tricarboxylate transporter receptor subunit TctC